MRENMKGIGKNIMRTAIPCLQTAILVSAVMMAMNPLSCRMTKFGLELLHPDAAMPVIRGFSVTGKQRISIEFSGAVTLTDSALSPAIEIVGVQYTESESGAYIVECEFAETLAAGKRYAFSGRAEDESGNSLTFSLPVEGRNYEIPALEITEVHNRKGSGKEHSVAYPKEEFIELLVLHDGNLAGLEIFSADKNAAVYTFPAVQVKKKEIIIVHLTNADEDGAVSETGGNIKLSKTHWYSSDSARDLWKDGKKSCLADACDAILLVNPVENTVLDAFLYAPDAAEDWPKESIRLAAERSVDAGCWPDADVKSAVQSDGISPSKSFIKTGRKNAADAWDISKSRGETPGSVRR